MKRPQQPQVVALTTAIAISMLTIAASQPAQAQTYNAIYNFSGCGYGSYPSGALLMDGSRSLYGTTEFGGSTCARKARAWSFA